LLKSNFELASVTFFLFNTDMDLSEQERYEQLVADIKDADGAITAADRAILFYLSDRPNVHAMQIDRNGFVVRLGALTADPELSHLEVVRDAAKERFASALSEHAELKKKLHAEVHYVGGIEQQS
jgi:hypothetical protein